MLPVCRCSLSALTTGKAMETELKASQHPLDKFAYCPVCGCRRFDVATVKSKRCADCGFELFMNPSASVAVFIRNGRIDLFDSCENIRARTGLGLDEYFRRTYRFE